MGYYFELRPKDRQSVSVADYKQRFLGIGLEPHPALTHPDEEEEIRKKYVDDVMYSGGTITIMPWKESPCGVTAEARVSWSENADSIVPIIEELLTIAAKVNADLYTGDNQLITNNEMQCAADIFLRGRKMGLGMFGTIDPEKAGRTNQQSDPRPQ